MKSKIGVGLIGCGNISEAYLKAAVQFPIIDMISCADVNADAAQVKAVEYGIDAQSVDELLADPRIDIVLNLTTPQHHVDIGVQALSAGKHTYSEKPLALSTEQAEILVQLSRQSSLRVGCAPDTFLSGAHQTARYAIDSHQIGKPVSGTAFMMGPGHESWHPDPDFYYQSGGGPLMDMGPYYLTALVDLLGPVESVVGAAKAAFDTRAIGSGARKGELFPVEVPTHISGILNFENGAMVTITTSFDVPKHNHSPLEIYGTHGSLLAGDPNKFEREVKVAQKNGEWETIEQKHLYGDGNYRILGLVDMAHSIVSDRPHRASLELSLHVLEIMEKILASAETETVLYLKHGCQRPAPMPTHLAFGHLE